MCGIAGVLNFDGRPGDGRLAGELADLLAHRGPDGRGVEVNGPLALGHRRLSILDLAGGAQPMYSRSRDYLISFNGEIFNYLELKAELQARGACFLTSSDTEVILEAFACWGPESFGRFNGQFAFVLYDTKKQELYLVRDRMGEKPLYYSLTPRALVFGSELKVVHHFLSKGKGEIKLDPEAFLDFLSLNYIPGVKTMLKGVKILAPGTYLHVQNAALSTRSFLRGGAGTEVAEESGALQGLFDQSLDIRLRSDVPVGLYLSGGLDSTCVACALARRHATDVTAFVADFGQRGFSEAANAREVCLRLGIPCELLRIEPLGSELPGLIEKLVWHGDQPLADSSALPVFLLSQATSRKVKVVLSGDGGDELFAGYLTYPATLMASRLPAFLRRLGPVLSRLVPQRSIGRSKVGLFEMLERFLRNLDLPPAAAHFAWNGMFRLQEKLRLVHPALLDGLDPEETFSSLAADEGLSLLRPSLKALLKADQHTYLACDILSKMDRMSMAHGLEVRPVFMDPRLVDFSHALAPSLIRRGLKGKQILRRHLQASAPWYNLGRRKQGFSIPVHLWFRTVLKDFFSDLLYSKSSRECGLFDHEQLLSLWETHLSGRRSIGFELWGIMISLLWARHFLEKMGTVPISSRNWS